MQCIEEVQRDLRARGLESSDMLCFIDYTVRHSIYLSNACVLLFVCVPEHIAWPPCPNLTLRYPKLYDTLSSPLAQSRCTSLSQLSSCGYAVHLIQAASNPI